MTKQRGLGKGLQEMGLTELLSSINKPSQSSITGQLTQIGVSSLQPGKYQPRKNFNQDSLCELAQSIKTQGIIQPLVIRKIKDSKYEIIAGERRWRAAQIAGLSKVPAIIKDIADEAAMAIGLIENMQREDLNAIDLALGIDRLINEFRLTHQHIADTLGKSRAAVSNTLRLLQLEAGLQQFVKEGSLDMGHARCLLSLPEGKRLEVAKLIMAKKLSVRATEELVKQMLEQRLAATKTNMPTLDLKPYQNQLSHKFGKDVKISSNAITFKFTKESLASLIAKLTT